MEEDHDGGGGFTVVKDGASTMKSVKAKTTDGKQTVMLGISQEEAQAIYRNQLKRGRGIIGLDSDEEDAERARIEKEEAQEQDGDFFKYQQELLKELNKEGLPVVGQTHISNGMYGAKKQKTESRKDMYGFMAKQ